MRATRNAAKGTPPAKKAGKGTPGKGTPKAEKKEDNITAEKEDNIKIEATSVSVTVVEENKEDKLLVTEKVEAVEVVTTNVVVEDSEKESDKAVFEAKDSPLDAAKASQEAEETVHKLINAEASKAGEEVFAEKEVGDQEMQEESAEDQIEEADVKEDAEEEDDEEEDEEDDDEDDDEGDNELVDQRPATERQKRKKLEVFVGGLDKDATMEDVKRHFEVVGEVLEVRLMTHPESGRNKGYAFVRFATPEQAIRAATELDRAKIRDKECAVVPSEENDTLFVGNICKSWSLEQITGKLKEFGVDGIDEMVLVEDHDNEGHNRGHVFLEFVSHSDAIKAFKRLSKPDALFGCDRSAKVAWAEGSSELDETVMVKVKSVFVGGLPEEWDDGKLREHFGKYGDIERIVLAKNIAKSKRTDYAFVNFASRDAAVTAIEALNDTELTDGDKKLKLKVELAKPTSRKKRMRGYRGSYPIGGRPSKQKKAGDGRGDRKKGESRRGDKKRGEGGRPEKRKGEGSRGVSDGGRGVRMGSEKNSRGAKRKPQDDRPLPEERPRDRQNRGSRNFRTGAAAPRGGRIGSSSRRGRMSTYDDEDYMPLGARISPGYTPARGYPGRSSREVAYPLRAERDVPYSGLGVKRSYSAVDEEAAYYGAGSRGYPRARVEYGDPALYSDPLRAPSLGHSSLGHVLPRGGHGYSSVLPGAADYGPYAPTAAADPRGAAYPPAYYGSRGSGAYY
ncbi:hypothetical protein L7F22_047637 [Adiantum nelumboides]|nr:hypothetical protein [Adiantum nelumboides]